jgi:hypothetical protein
MVRPLLFYECNSLRVLALFPEPHGKISLCRDEPDISHDQEYPVKHQLLCRRIDDPAKTLFPVLLTSEEHGVAVAQNFENFESTAEEHAFMIVTVQGMVDLEEGREKTPGTKSYANGIGSVFPARCIEPDNVFR